MGRIIMMIKLTETVPGMEQECLITSFIRNKQPQPIVNVQAKYL